MKCPKCDARNVKYLTPRERSAPPNRNPVLRKDFKAKCSKCKWEGEL